MSLDVELVHQGYAALNEALETADFQPFIAFIEQRCDPKIVLKPAGVFPESAETRGREGMMRLLTAQAEAFERLRIEPQEVIEAGDRIVVSVSFGGRARHTGLEVDVSVAHVWTLHNHKALRLDMYSSKAEALEAVEKC
jgi:ketosteroid isomerase-like protein